MSIWDFLQMSGQDRTRALNRFMNEDVAHFVPPELRSRLGLLGDMTPTAQMGAAMQDSGEMFAPGKTGQERFNSGVSMLTNTAGAMAPMAGVGKYGAKAADAVMDTVMGFAPMARGGMDGMGQFAMDESGVLRTGRGGMARAPFDEAGRGFPDSAKVRGVGDNGGPVMWDPLDSIDGPAHSLPQWAGRAENRTTPYPRYEPKKQTPRMDRLMQRIDNPDDPIRGMFKDYVEKGKELRGEDWYNTEELRDWFTSALGKDEGDRQWREYMELIGTTSTGAKVPQNIRVASFFRALDPADRAAVADLVNARGITPKKAAEELGVLPANTPDNYGYGHVKQRNQAGNVSNREGGMWEREVPEGLTGAARTKWLQANPKVKGFANDLMGDDTNIAADMHFMRMLAMSDGGGDFLTAQAKLSAVDYETAKQAIGPRRINRYTARRMVNGKEVREVNLYKAYQDGVLKDPSVFQGTPTAWADTPKANEYDAFEKMAQRVAEEYGMTPAQFQASLWMGAGDMTGLADESQGTFMELFRRSLDKRAGERGLSRREMLMDFLQNKAPLAVAPVGVGGLLSTQPDDQDQYRGGT